MLTSTRMRVQRPRPRLFIRRPSRLVTLLLALVFVAGPLLSQATAPHSALAAGLTPPPLLNPDYLLPVVSTPQGTLYRATTAQYLSLLNLQQQAVTNTLRDHGLPDSDAAAVQSWARADADAELWALLVQAIKTPSAQRTTDQQNAVAWLTTVAQRQHVSSANNAGLEFVKWSGLSSAGYQTLIGGSPTETQVEDFLRPGSTNPTNYCGYRSPTPFETEYTGWNIAECVVPPSPFFIAQSPSYDQFVKWGAATANSDLYTSAGFSQLATDMAIGVGVGVGASVAGLGTVGAAIGFVAGDTAAWVTLFPFSTAASVVGSVVAMVVVVIIAIAVAVVQAINLGNLLALPGQLATAVTGARTTPPDVSAMLADPNQARSLYALLVGAMLPLPRATTCDNTIHGVDFVPCLNPTPIPPGANSDPVFQLTAQGATTSTVANTITWKDTVANSIQTARLSNIWFISHPSGSTTESQSLRIHYTDWNGVGQTAWLFKDADGDYAFFGMKDVAATDAPLDPATCQALGSCFYSPSIKLVDAAGNKYSAAAVQSQPTVAPTVSADPTEGSPVTFRANGASALGLQLTYSWAFGLPNTGLTCVIETGVCSYGYGDTATGEEATHTFTAPGRYPVRLIATDSTGRSTEDVFFVEVANVPPTVTLWPEYPQPPLLCAGFCDNHSVDLGAMTTLHVVIQDPGDDEFMGVSVNWGDGDPINLSLFVPGPWKDGRVLTETHTYTNPGVYDVSVSVIDGGNASAGATTTETVVGTTAVAWAAPAAISYGTPLTAAQLNATATLADSTTSVDGTFSYTVDGNPVSADDNALLAVGDHTLTASFMPDDPSLYTTPDPVSVTLTVNAAVLTISANDQTMLLHGVLPALTYSYSGFVNGDTAPATAPTCTTAATRASAVGSYAITCGGASDPNYIIAYEAGAISVQYAWKGFSPPINDPAAGATTMSVFKAGKMLPVTFLLTDASGKPVKAAHTPLFSVSAPQSCATAQPSSAPGSVQVPFMRVGTFYMYLYKVPTDLAGQCQALNVTLDDGTTHSVVVVIK